ncbi:MAG: hypothetical protein AAGJ82_08350 [Bacteroidota bacterium]
MRNKHLCIIWVSLLLSFVGLASACGEEGAVQAEDLVGRWEISSAMRGGKVTTTMDQMFFDFGTDGKLVTNMLGQDQTFQYTLDGNTIQQREGVLEADYEIVHFATDSLVLRSTIRSQQFLLTLRQAN